MTSAKRSPRIVRLAVVLILLDLVLYALSLAGNLYGPSEWTRLGLPAFFLTIPTVLLSPAVIRAGALRSKRRSWLRPCRRVVGGLAAVCIVATVAGTLGLLVAVGGGGRINSGNAPQPIVHDPGPYSLNNQPVSRSRWLAAAVSFQIAWHGLPLAGLLVLLYSALSEPKESATGPGAEAEPAASPEPGHESDSGPS